MMSFNSYEFIFVFLPIVLVIFFTLPRKFALSWLILSSIFFYGFMDWRYVPLLLLSVCVNYFVGKMIESTSAKKLWLYSVIAFNFGVLCLFKCRGVLPPGISFYTFTQTAYIIDVYRNTVKSPSLLEYSGYVMFFPHITSGPITDSKKFLPAINEMFTPNYENIARGITLFVLGMFKKVCIADMIARDVNTMFMNAGILTFFEAWTAALSYSVQLYFDFSGYSDMALGLGLMLNMKLPENFASPYKSTSIIDFWRRWHMSLGAWIKNYLYIPLGGSREGDFRRTRNVILCMLFVGIWHGTGWTFALWGLAHGIMLAVNHQWRRLGVKIPGVLSWAVTFLCVVVLWVVFRAGSVSEAGKIISAMFDVRHMVLPERLAKYLGFLCNYGVSFGVLSGNRKILITLLAVVLFCPNTKQILERFRPSAVWVLVVVGLAVVSFVNFSGISDFLYFRF